MNTEELIRLGVPAGKPIQLAHEFVRNFIAHGSDGAELEAEIFNIVADPSAYDELKAALERIGVEPPFIGDIADRPENLRGVGNSGRLLDSGHARPFLGTPHGATR